MESTNVQASVPLNFRMDTADTYLFDGLSLTEAEAMLDTVDFYNEIDVNIRLGHYLTRYRQLARVLTPILTFDDTRRD